MTEGGAAGAMLAMRHLLRLASCPMAWDDRGIE